MQLALFFTHGVSLREWAQVGMLEREVALYLGLKRMGVGVNFVTYGDGGDDEFTDLARGLVVRCNRWRLPQTLYGRLIPRLHGRVLSRASVFKSNQILGADIALAAAKRFGKPFIARCGYLRSGFMEHAHGKKSALAEVARDFEAHVFTGADRVVVTTGRMRDAVIGRYGIEKSVVRVIPNFVDTARFQPREPMDRRRLCFIGRLAEQKNLFALLEAIEGMEVELTVVGDGHLRPGLERMVREKNLPVRFLGSIPHGSLPDVLGECGIFVLPSLYEGHPKSLLEAMACGLPVIGANVPGIGDLLHHRETGYLCGTSPESIREALRTLSGDEDLCLRMGGAARQFITGSCTLDRVVEMEFGLLKELAS
jgi:glycosyltransferase involved in cell wall biosynthesis